MADRKPVNPAMSKFLSRTRPDKGQAEYVQDMATQKPGRGQLSASASPEQRVAGNLMHLMKAGQHGGDTIYLPPVQEEPREPLGTDRKERSKEFRGNALYNSSVRSNPRLFVGPEFPGVDKNGFEKRHDPSPRGALSSFIADELGGLSTMTPQLRVLLGHLYGDAGSDTDPGYAPKRKPLTPYKSPKLPPGKGPGDGGRKDSLDHEPWHPIPPAPGANPVKPKPDQRTTFTG